MSTCVDQASGTSIIITCGSGRPLATRKSATLSSDAESLPPGRMIGLKSAMCSAIAALSSSGSRALIHVWLPRSVLISPLCASSRYGCARSHVGNVLVEKRECTTGDRRAHVRIGEVRVERRELLRQREPFVDDGLRRAARDVKVVAREPPRALADHEERALERLHRRDASDEELLHHRARRLGERTEHARIDRHVAPADHDLIVVAHDRLEHAHLLLLLLSVAREKHLHDAVVARVRQLDVASLELVLEERVRDLNQDPRAVAALGVCAGRPAVRQAAQDLEALVDEVVRGLTVDFSDES